MEKIVIVLEKSMKIFHHTLRFLSVFIFLYGIFSVISCSFTLSNWHWMSDLTFFLLTVYGFLLFLEEIEVIIKVNPTNEKNKERSTS